VTTERHFARGMRALREQRSLSQAGLASAAGLRYQSTVWKCESGARSIRLGEAMDVAAFFGMSVEQVCQAGSGDEVLLPDTAVIPRAAVAARLRALADEIGGAQ
jgi:DNA-binding XRE family transcriptional regulator